MFDIFLDKEFAVNKNSNTNIHDRLNSCFKVFYFSTYTTGDNIIESKTMNLNRYMPRSLDDQNRYIKSYDIDGMISGVSPKDIANIIYSRFSHDFCANARTQQLTKKFYFTYRNTLMDIKDFQKQYLGKFISSLGEINLFICFQNKARKINELQDSIFKAIIDIDVSNNNIEEIKIQKMLIECQKQLKK